MSSLGFFTLAQKQQHEKECDEIGKLKHILTKEYNAMKHNNDTNDKDDDIVSRRYYRIQDPEQSFAEVLHVFGKDNSVTSRDIVQALHSGSILIPQMERTDDASLPHNWQLRFVYHQIFDFFQHDHHSHACGSCLKALRLMQLRTPDEEAAYFAASDRAFQHWKLKGTEPLQHPDTVKKNEMNFEIISPKGCTGVNVLEVLDRFLTPTPMEPKKEDSRTELEDTMDDNDDDEKSVWSVDSIVESVEEFITPVPEASDRFEHGILLFTDVDNSTHHFQPNFLPPYSGKHKFILDVLHTRRGKPKAIRKLAKGNSLLPGVIQCDHRLTQYSSEEDSSSHKKSVASSKKKPGKLRSKFQKLFQSKAEVVEANK